MTDTTVIKIPQWQGSAAPRARELAEGADLLALMVPAARRLRVQVPASAGEQSGDVRALEVLTAVADEARARLAEAGDDLVVTVGGDCGVELAPVSAALDRHGDALAVVWFDAHGDLNTPGSSPSHAFHGMVLRTLLGEGPAELVPERPLRPGQVVLAGVRALDQAESDFIADEQIRVVGDDAEALVAAVEATGASAVYVHIDLDVLDPGDFSSMSFPEPGGLHPDQLRAAVGALTGRFALAGLGVTEYQPGSAEDHHTLRRLVPALLS